MSRMYSGSSAVPIATPVARASAALTAAVLGLFILFGVGFAHVDSVHNAAHDSRHSVAFPCH